MPKDHGIGASSKRREDVRFLTGKGRYTDDINLPGQAYVHFLRSDVAHGKLNKVDTSVAAEMPELPVQERIHQHEIAARLAFGDVIQQLRVPDSTGQRGLDRAFAGTVHPGHSPNPPARSISASRRRARNSIGRTLSVLSSNAFPISR